MNKPKIHKVETVGRMKSDADDRKKILEGLLTFIHPLKIETHIQENLPEGFRATVSSTVVTMTSSKKRSKKSN